MTVADASGSVDAPGPLVEPVADLTAEQRARAERQLALPGFDERAQRRLRAARVLVIGAGGLGSGSVPYLTGAGVGTIGIVDDDVVELSNLHRQVAHGTADLGRDKTASLARTSEALDAGVRIVQHRLRLTASNAQEIFADYDLVIDGSDNFPTRYLANDAAEIAGIPLVWGAILQYHGQVGVAWHAHGPGYRDLFPTPPAPDDVLSCGTGGVLPGLCGTVGSLLATEAMKVITGIGEPLIGRVLLYDALAARIRELPYRRDPTAQPVTDLIDYALFCAGPEPTPSAVAAEELAGLLSGGLPVRLIDVRNPDERAEALIPGSLPLPLPDLEAAAEVAESQALVDLPGLAELPTGGEVIVYCERDPRSIRAVEVLARGGVPAVRYLRGGIRGLAGTAPELVERSGGMEQRR